jgi:hypothetical protein
MVQKASFGAPLGVLMSTALKTARLSFRLPVRYLDRLGPVWRISQLSRFDIDC